MTARAASTQNGPRAAVALTASAMLIAWMAWLGLRSRQEPNFCPPFFVKQGARCCAPGQTLADGHCRGQPHSCPSPFRFSVVATMPGCVAPASRRPMPAGAMLLGPTDWDSAELVPRQTVAVSAFEIDSHEVTVERYVQCARRGLCRARSDLVEPGQPVTNLPAAEAETFCAYEGGRLPTSRQWLYAAAGPRGQRFPWGPHGLVCRRSAFGLVDGPCATGGTTPELAGLRPDGASPAGVDDLSGNVAEWAREADGQLSAHGGSFRSKGASEQKSWSTEPPAASAHLGFRCAYAVP